MFKLGQKWLILDGSYGLEKYIFEVGEVVSVHFATQHPSCHLKFADGLTEYCSVDVDEVILWVELDPKDEEIARLKTKLAERMLTIHALRQELDRLRQGLIQQDPYRFDL